MRRNKLYLKLINCARWRRLRAEVLTEHPLCEACQTLGVVEASCCVHHIVPVESGKDEQECAQLAYSRGNLQALCRKCHHDIHAHSHSKELARGRSDLKVNAWISRRGGAFFSKGKFFRNTRALSWGEGEDFEKLVFPKYGVGGNDACPAEEVAVEEL